MEQRSNVIGSFIRRKREEVKVLDQSDLAKLAGVNKSTISRIESGVSIPQADVLIRIVKALKLDLIELFTELGVATGRDLPELQTYLVEKYGCSEEKAAHIARHVELDVA